MVLRGNRVEEFDFESATRKQLRGNIYLAKVTRVEPSLQAAFVDYGGNRHGFLAFSEIHPDYYQIPVADRQALIEAEEWENAQAEARSGDVEDLAAEPPSGGTVADSSVNDDPASETATGNEQNDEPDAAESQSPEPKANEVLDIDEQAAERSASPEEQGDTEEDSGSVKAESTGLGESVVTEPPENQGEEAASDSAEPTQEDTAEGAQEAEAEPIQAEVSPADDAEETTDVETQAASVAAEVSDATDDTGTREDLEVGPNNIAADQDESPSAQIAQSETPQGEVAEDAEAAAEDASTPPTEEVDRAPETDAASPVEGSAGDDSNGDSVDVVSDDSVESVGAEDALEEVPERRKPRVRQYKIQEVIKRRQVLLVQVVKEERGNKGAALTDIPVVGRSILGAHAEHCTWRRHLPQDHLAGGS